MLDFLSMFQMAGVVSVHHIAFSYFVKESKNPFMLFLFAYLDKQVFRSWVYS